MILKTTKLTGAERVVCTLELLARGVVFSLGSDALEVVGVVLMTENANISYWDRIIDQFVRTSVWSDWCWGTGLKRI